MFSFVPNASELYRGQLKKTEKLESQTKAWIIKNRETALTQSLCVTNLSPNTFEKGDDFIHSVHLVTNKAGQYCVGTRRAGSGLAASSTYDPVIAIARRCYVCDDPFCPNVDLLNRGFHFLGDHSVSEKQRIEKNTDFRSRRSKIRFSPGILEHSSERHRNAENCDSNSAHGEAVWCHQCRTKTNSAIIATSVPKSSNKGSDTAFHRIRAVLFPNYIKANPRSSAPHKQQHLETSYSEKFSKSSGICSSFSAGATKGTDSTTHSCCGGQYHSHTFLEDDGNDNTSVMMRGKGKSDVRRQLDGGPMSVDRLSQSSQTNILHHSEKDNHKNICMTFWKPQLSFNQYKYGDKPVDFVSLWPDVTSLSKTMSEVCHDTVLRRAVLDMCKMALRCGPLQLLKALLNLKLVNLDQVFEDGSGMLHLALLARNSEAASYLCHTGIYPKLRDKFGHTADQVCFCVKIRKSLPQRYLINTGNPASKYSKPMIQPSTHDIDSIFYLAKSSKNFDELQKKLQTFEFDVNGECDSKGDSLIHIVTLGGLSHLPLLLTLVRIQGADIELCNHEGMTPLMIAAQNGDPVLCDVLLCVFGCNPNKPNPHSGSCALHYACVHNCSEVVNCLLNRGADFNLEDFEGRRPDDATISNETEDCCEILRSRRIQRSEYLSQLVEQGDVFQSLVKYTDLYVVDHNGRTLIMAAAECNRVDHLETLLAVEGSPIDAQHERTGQTALSIAARVGNMETVRVLLSHDSNPNIRDLHGYLPLHYAVMNDHGEVVETMLEFFPKTYTGLHLALKLCVKSPMYNRIKTAMNKRRDEIVTPELYDCALTGEAERLFRVLEEGDSVNLKRGVAPLCLAVENGHLEVVKLLYERGGDITKRHPVTMATVLHSAAKMGHNEVVEFLLQFCRPPTSPMFSVLSSKGKAVSLKPFKDFPSDSCYKEVDINTLNGDKKTPLQLAADRGYSKIVRMLLDHGATTALLDDQGELIQCPEYDGVRIMIRMYREHHTTEIMKAILDRRGLGALKQMWLPRFDHNLRDKSGSTPLMVACRAGKLDVVKFLLESAIYPDCEPEDSAGEDSDTDSGVERTSSKTMNSNDKKGELYENSSYPNSQSSAYTPSVLAARNPTTEHGRISVLEQTMPTGTARDWQTSLLMSLEAEDDDFIKSTPARFILHNTPMISSSKYVMTKLMSDLEKPKGLHIYHDNKVCHLCAVNLYDGSTALHRAMEGADNSQLVQLLLQRDCTVAHVQNFSGYSPLHMACKLGRKKVVQILLAVHDIDIRCRTSEGKQAEELCTSKSIRKLLIKARSDRPPQEVQIEVPDSPIPSLTSSYNDENAVTTINLDKIGDKYKALKRNMTSGAEFNF